MARYPHRSPIDLANLGGKTDRDVRIGAAARRHKRRQIAVGALGAALIIGAGLLYAHFRPQDHVSSASTCPVRVQCGHCGYTATLQVPMTQKFPIKCPKCGQQACQPLWRCRHCGAEFVPEPTQHPVRCPKCGSTRVGSAVEIGD